MILYDLGSWLKMEEKVFFCMYSPKQEDLVPFLPRYEHQESLGQPWFCSSGTYWSSWPYSRYDGVVVTVWEMSSVVVIKSFVFRRANDAVSP